MYNIYINIFIYILIFIYIIYIYIIHIVLEIGFAGAKSGGGITRHI